MSHRDTFERVLASLHDATLDDTHWPITSALIDEACRTTGNALVASERSGDKSEIAFRACYYRGERNEGLEKYYFRNYHHLDERVPRIRELPDSLLVHMSDLYTEHEKRTSPAYNEALLQTGDRNGLAVRLDASSGTSVSWIIANPARPGSWQSDQTQMIERLLPHLRQFVRVRQALSLARALGATLGELLDNTRIGVIQLDRRGRIVEANDRALAILRQGGGLYERDGVLRAWLPADNTRLERLLARALPAFGEAAFSGSTTIRRAPPLPILAVHVSPVGSRREDFGIRRVAALALLRDEGRQVRIDPDSPMKIDAGLVSAALGLTEAEGRVAALLAEGGMVRDIAAAMGRKESSIRWHLHNIFRKRGISRQAELVRLVHSAAGSWQSRR